MSEMDSAAASMLQLRSSEQGPSPSCANPPSGDLGNERCGEGSAVIPFRQFILLWQVPTTAPGEFFSRVGDADYMELLHGDGALGDRDDMKARDDTDT